MQFIHAQGETKDDKPRRVMLSFGPEHSTLGEKQVELAWQEATRSVKFKPDILLFVALQFSAEASSFIESISKQRAGVELLKVQMNHDYSVRDLKKKSSSSDNFWLLGEPDVQVNRITSGDDKGKITIKVNGYDYYNPSRHVVEAGGEKDIVCWLLDEDYDERCMIPSQIFILVGKDKNRWPKIKRDLKAIIDEDKVESFSSSKSLAFDPPKNNKIAVKIIDKRGVESLKVIDLKKI